jgi:hypothetical protein
MIILRFLGGFIFTILVNIFQGFPVWN